MRHQCRRIGVLGLTAAVACTSGVIPVWAGEASIDVDETMYVNLDYYGQLSKVNVVKGCTLNGQTSFTDYGNYTAVTNMSDYTQPQLGDGQVTWNLPADEGQRFYYKCQMDAAQVTLPWNFDVSYKLNGVKKNGDQLAGASGLVEIHVDAAANDSAPEYFRNNMVLAVAVLVDMNDCYSVEADGAQIQTIGDQKAVVFTALPGEDGDYTVRIGSDRFETSGVFMAMTPITVSDMEHITDLKDAKDTWKASGDQLYDSMEQMALSVEAMRDGVNELQNGLGSAEEARKTWSGAKDGILDGNDKVLESLTQVSNQMEAMIPHIETAKEAADVVHQSLGDMVNTMREMQDPLRKLNSSLKGVKDNAEDLGGNVSSLNTLMQQIIALDAALQASEQAYVTQLAQLEGSLAQVQDDYDMGDQDLENDLPQATASDAEAAGDSSQTADSAGAGGITLDGQELIAVLTQKKQALETLSAASNRLASRLSGLLDDTADSAKYTAELMDNLDFLVEDTTALYDSVDVYYPDLQAALDDSEELVNRTTDALNQGISTAAILQDTLRASSDSLDAAARDSIRGTLDLLDKSLGMLDATTAMRQAGRTMKDTIDKEWNDLDGDTRFLYMDPSAEKASFTSDKNQEPESVQVVLRTQEISMDDDDEVLDAETQASSSGPLQRIWSVFVQLWKSVTALFRR